LQLLHCSDCECFGAESVFDDLSRDTLEGITAWFLEELDGIDFISEHDLEKYRLSRLTYGLIESDLGDRMKSDKGILSAHPELKTEAFLLGLAFTRSNVPLARRSIPEFIRAHLSEKRTDRAIIEDAIAKREFSDESFIALIRLSVLFGAFQATRYAALDGQFKSAIEGRLNGIEIQKCWFARWINDPENRPTREDPREPSQRLVELCARIRVGKIAPWGPYPVEWYRRILSEKSQKLSPDCPDLEVADGFQKLNATVLVALREHPTITQDILPPTNFGDFKLTRPPGVGRP
jgi:hypothetical protein